MRKIKIRLKKITGSLLFVAFIISNVLYGNSGPIEFINGNIVAIEDTPIQLKNENISIILRKSASVYSSIEANLFLSNTSDVIVKQKMTYPYGYYLNDYKVYTNDTLVKDVIYSENQWIKFGYDQNGPVTNFYPKCFTIKTVFKPHEKKKISHFSKFSSLIPFNLNYYLHTGRNWKGVIDKADIKIQLENIKFSDLTSLHFNSMQYYNFNCDTGTINISYTNFKPDIFDDIELSTRDFYLLKGVSPIFTNNINSFKENVVSFIIQPFYSIKTNFLIPLGYGKDHLSVGITSEKATSEEHVSFTGRFLVYKNKLYIPDQYSKTIKIFSLNGLFDASIAVHGYPYSCQIVNGIIYVLTYHSSINELYELINNHTIKVSNLIRQKEILNNVYVQNDNARQKAYDFLLNNNELKTQVISYSDKNKCISLNGKSINTSFIGIPDSYKTFQFNHSFLGFFENKIYALKGYGTNVLFCTYKPKTKRNKTDTNLLNVMTFFLMNNGF